MMLLAGTGISSTEQRTLTHEPGIFARMEASCLEIEGSSTSRQEYPNERPGDEPVAPVHDRRRSDCEITPKIQQRYIRTANGSNDETRAIGDAVIILTSSSKQFRLDRIEGFEVLKD
jgi:hypothetical protein